MNILSSENLRVIGLWCDLTKKEHKDCIEREERLLHAASSLSKTALQRDRLAQWANDIEDLADAIPDTHGLLILQVWEGLHPPIRRQISPNHASWGSFCTALRELQYGTSKGSIQTAQNVVPVPWHRQRLPLHVPYKIGDRPSTTPLVVKLTAHMPEVYRGRDPTQTRIPDKKKKKGNGKKSITNAANYYDSDGSTSAVHYTRYYWPKYVFPAIFVSGPLRSIRQVGLKLKGLMYDARKTIMDLGTACLEIEPLLHTSPQIYTKEQWEGIMHVPSSERGFKIGLAIEFPTHTLSFNSFDNNFRIHWRTPTEEKAHYRARYVPDPVHDYPGWCVYTAKWLARRLRKLSKTMTLVSALSRSGKHPFRGLGKYGTNDVMAIAGFFPWILFYTVLSNPVLFCILCEAFIQFITPKALQTRYDLYTTDSRIDSRISLTFSPGHTYAESLKVHGRKRAHVTELEARLIDQYNLSRSAPGTSSDFFTASRKVARLPLTLAFDMSSIRFAVTQYGHLGSVIAGSAWDSVLSELQSTRSLVVKQEKEYRQLTKDIEDEPNRLRFKSIVLLTSEEIEILANSFPWEENPIITYYRTHPSFLDHETRIDSTSLSLLRQPTRWRETKLFSTANRKGYTWSLFHPPFTIYQPKQTKWDNVDEPPPLIKPPVPMFTLESERTRDAYTFSHVKEETKGYTVGPHDFVGHGHYINMGRTSYLLPPISKPLLTHNCRFAGLCFWHESLTQAQMLALNRARDAKTLYVKGMRKMSLADTTAEKKWRTSRTSDFKKTHPAATNSEIASYVRRERKKERAGLLDVIRVLSQEEEVGRRQRGKNSSPRNSARVKNRSLIKTLAKKWRDI
ncbi:hypothetical protein R3P38DRAFT_2576965 [Favolaschia claudopus]|uniref:Uncharacterized protein n=1 Tax=Favolaschia claudopus TaxID=2862362 RepID=A0AAV9ZI51_9AGAR